MTIVRPVLSRPAAVRRVKDQARQTLTIAAAGEEVVAAMTVETVQTVGTVVNISSADFETITKESGDRVVVVDWYTDWCGPCKVGRVQKFTTND